MGKETKTNAVRILDRNKIKYELITYECDEFVDGLHTAEITGAPVEQSYKTLVMQGKSKKYYVKVRAYKTKNSKTVYSKWSKVKSIKTK